MAEHMNTLTDAYRCLVARSRPQQSATDVASAVVSGVCGHVSGGAAGFGGVTSADVTCLSLSLVHRIVSAPTAEGAPAEVSHYCGELLEVLFEDLELMPQLVHHFQSEDQFVSHLAAKCVSACVFHHLQTSVMVSPVWREKCVAAFLNAPPGTELDACLWSLTHVLKKLVKGLHHEIIGKLLSDFDSSLCTLYSKFLPEETQSLEGFAYSSSSSSQWVTTFCLLLDLLEVLSASGATCAPAARAKSQRILHARASALLTAISRVSEYFAKKKVALLLKRAALQKLGEDWTPGGAAPAGPRRDDVGSDGSRLSRSVLAAVDGGWLQSVEVGSEAFFGGTKCVAAGEVPKADGVMLRAVALLVLKSIELHIQTSGGAGLEGAAEVYGYLQSLWGFLRRRSVQLTAVTHLCCWISLLFGEQDDDMMEAARALLSIFLHHRRHSGSDGPAVLEAACASGCNPHCHFLFLLQSVSFDHSILLDFLISSETCFLEYFVRYLKCLKDDWQGFTAACGRHGEADCSLSLQQQQQRASCGGEKPAVTCRGGPNDAVASPCVQPTGGESPQRMLSPAPEVRLVDYDSSDESDAETMEVSEGEPGPSDSGLNASDAEMSKRPTSFQQKRYASSTLLNKAGFNPEVFLLSRSGETPRPNAAPWPGDEASARAVQCLSKLREVVTRLHAKKLFPYNPLSLLKLITQVEKLPQHPPSPN